MEDHGDDDDVPSNNGSGQPTGKKDKSPSPDYPPQDSLTAEQLQRPSEPYAQLIYSLLLDIHPNELGLKGVYRAMKLRWPYYKYCVESHGWESSVRHNLNNHQGTSFLKGKRENKGFYWSARPGYPPKADSDKKRQAPQQQPRPRADNLPRLPPQQGMNLTQWNNPYVPQMSNGLNGPVPHGQQAFFVPPAQPWPGNAQLPSHSMLGNGPLPSMAPTGQPLPNLNQPYTGVPFQSSVNTTSSVVQSQVDPISHQGNSQSSQTQPINDESVAQTTTAQHQQTSAYAGMPCTVAGLDTIGRFIKEMDNLTNAIERERAHYAIAVARRRLLHNASQPSKPPGLTPEEDRAVDLLLRDADLMYGHLQVIIQKHANPNFVGFSGPPKAPVPLCKDALKLAYRSFHEDYTSDPLSDSSETDEGDKTVEGGESIPDRDVDIDQKS